MKVQSTASAGPAGDRWLRLSMIAAALILALALFLRIFGFDFVRPDGRFWTNPNLDLAAMMAGFEAIQQQPWSFPPTITDRLVAPLSTSIVFTDSIPWLTLLMKALGLGDAFNPLGGFLLGSYLLQAVSMAAVLWAAGARRASSYVAGCALALLFPAWLMRQFGHIALSGHWIILLALALSIAVARNGLSWRRATGFALLVALAAGVHAYHLVPVAVCLAAALLAELLQKGRAALARVLLAGGLSCLALAISYVVLGYGVGTGGEAQGGQALGLYSMNLLGPIWPQASWLFGQRWTGSWFTGIMDPNGSQFFEGFNYLGAGVLLVAAFAGVLFAARAARGEIDWRRAALRWSPLLLGSLALTCAAIGPKVYLGNTLLMDLPRPDGAVGAALSLFRCHGRLFWAVGYLILAASVAIVDRWRRGRAFALAVLAAAVGLQVADIGEVHEGLNARYAAVPVRLYPPALATSEALRGRPWRFAPVYHCTSDSLDKEVAAELSLVAIRRGGDSNGVGTARDPKLPCSVPTELRRTAKAGDPTITVVLNAGRPRGGNFDALRDRTDCYSFLRGLVCGAGLDGIEGLTPAPPRSFVTDTRSKDMEVSFVKPTPILQSGWAAPESQGVWSVGHLSKLRIPLPRTLRKTPIVLEFKATSFAAPSAAAQPIFVSANGRPLERWSVEKHVFRPYSVEIPADLVQGDHLDLQFDIPGAAAPGGADNRLLGIGLQTMTVSH